MASEARRESHKTHGLRYTRLYNIWSNMKSRCNNPKHTYYKNYGGRGITICQEWQNDFQSFYNWAMANGYREKLTIDRIDTNGNYEPSNCQWASRKAQQNNRRYNHIITYNGESHSISEWSRITGINKGALYSRIYRGWSLEKTFSFVDGRRSY